ncbi:MAG: PAC2 family protein [Halobacteriales archaeon]
MGRPIRRGQKTVGPRTAKEGAARSEGTANGFLDGVNAGLVGQGMVSPLWVWVLLTPAHPRAPDLEATIRLVEAAGAVHGLDVDTADLEAFAAEIEQHCRDLAGRLESVESENRPEERMYM